MENNIDYRNIMPELVGLHIDQEVLPIYTNVHCTAEGIAFDMYLDASSNLLLEFDDPEFYITKPSNQALIDAWILKSNSRKIIAGYIQAVFDSWEREGGKK